MATRGLSWAILASLCLLATLLSVPTCDAARRLHHRRTTRQLLKKGTPHPFFRRLADTADNSTQFCETQGPVEDPSTWMGASITCLELWSTGAPIRAPADNATTKWGNIFLEYGNPIVSTFVDRNGTEYTMSPAANDLLSNSSINAMEMWPLLLVQAQLVNDTVASFQVVLYVPYSTIMATMINTTFEGLLYNSEPRLPGPAEYSWFRWTFGDNITVTNDTTKYGTLLHGNFDNLFTSVQDSQGKCQPALCADPTMESDACKYYLEFFGNGTGMTLNWDNSMHMSRDTELVPIFTAKERQYMTGFMELYELLSPLYRFVPHNYTFVSHGNPMGVPQNFNGTLFNATAVIPCDMM